MVFNTRSYNYKITDEYIAQHPVDQRDQSWLMVLDRRSKERQHKKFQDIIDHLEKDDLLILNNTKVIPARLIGKKLLKEASASPSEHKLPANCEILLLRDLGEDKWEVLVRPGKRLQVGTKVSFGENDELSAEMIKNTDFGGRIVKFSYEKGSFHEHLDKLGFIPLPPYIKDHDHINSDHHLAERYQTVYATQMGAAAAPTAGLHFTEELLKKVKEKGVKVEEITLHTGLGTFRPISTADIRDHEIHKEWYSVSDDVLKAIKETKRAGKRIIAVGTTVVRVLETIANSPPDPLSTAEPQRGGEKKEKSPLFISRSEKERGFRGELEGFTDIYIHPGHKFKLVDAMITNFHLPMSTLLVLVAAFAGKEFVLDSYLEALRRKYRFYSFGDAMFIC